MQSKQYFTKIKNYPHEKSTEPLNPGKKLHRAEKFADHMSIYDVIVPCALSRNNQVISYLDRELAEKCYDFDMMPDSLVKALDEGNRLLVIHNIH